MNDHLGHCPICQALLKREGDNLVCLEGDYIIPEKVFNEAWERYGVKRDAENLLQSLLDENLKRLNL